MKEFMDIKTRWNEVNALVRMNMEKMLFEKEHAKEGVIVEAMRYMLLSEGKMLRPFLVCIVNEMFGLSTDLVISGATAIEMIHTYTLIHDDLPAMDNDDYRRGKLSCHKKYGEAIAILAGDALLTLAFQLLVDTNVEPQIKLKLIKDTTELIGYKGIIAGQVLDLLAKKQKLDADELKKMRILKTSNLFMASCRYSATINNANAAELNALDNYAKSLGLAYQIKDDIEDGDELQSNFMLNDIVNESLNYLDIFGKKAKVLRDFTSYLFK
ncbi:polyprenyl synthetase family protein [Candidatus Bandiella euplotis]|uniref:Farnesyl diphosphate synthase n=1 Tax=Candidatus Bandiella euplotis TaxID=1664265 RepID=A0ABZ0ULA1_9RICK|nr:polyprenyl synthetase family protein [Candidatus Bandiella woodruffii]WPX96031.1 Farnesyl diphosphate synthase [Candidatus Bandiella woodruffii]